MHFSVVPFPVRATSIQNIPRRTRKIPGCQLISTIGATAVSIWNPPVFSVGAVMIFWINGSIIGPPTIISARPWRPCFQRRRLCLITHAVIMPRAIKNTPSNNKAYSIFFSISGDCTPINGTSITDLSWDHHKSPMMRRPEIMCIRRIVLSFGRRATNWASLIRVGFIGKYWIGAQGRTRTGMPCGEGF